MPPPHPSTTVPLREPLTQPLKPIYKHPLNQPSNKNPLKPALTPAPPPKTRQGDPQWLRIMHTKENQWRLINTIALHELNLLERSACQQLDALAANLDTLITQTAHFDALVAKCRALRARQNFLAVAGPPLRRAIRLLNRLQYPKVHAAVVENASAVDITAPGIDNELARFRTAARRFAKAAHQERLGDLATVAEQLEQLANVAAAEPGAVSCAAQAVVDAANASERARFEIVESVAEKHATAFVPEPSFLE